MRLLEITKKIRLLPLTEAGEDVHAAYLAIRNEPEIRNNMYGDHLISPEENESWLSNLSTRTDRVFFAVIYQGAVIGGASFINIDQNNRRAEWGFHLTSRVSGRGIGSALEFMFLDEAFERRGFEKLNCEVIEWNDAVVRMHKKFGFQAEGVRRRHLFRNGKFHDTVLLGITREEWREKRRQLLAPKEKRPRLLFTGGGGSVSQSLQAQWGERYELFFADANPHGFPPSIPEDRRLVIPFAKDPTFTDRLLELCQQHRIDLVVPGVDEELLVLARKKGAPDWPRILVPEVGFVSLMLDKLSCAHALAGAGLDAPKTLPLEQAGELPFPLIAKPRSGRGSRGVMRLTRPEQTDAYLALQEGKAEDYIAQELIAGEEYTVFVMADGGEAPCAVIPVLAFEKRGVTVRAQTEANAVIIAYARAFQAHFRPSGCYNIQCMLTPDGHVFPFEVNPRLSTTFVLAIATGYDPIPIALGEAAGPTFIPQQKLALHRSWHTHITHQDEGTTP
ncbi:UDP-4-amino-4,6-dideoxy-N-acetyl-beta-L-altrosamine N-acetyltransferase [Stappia sp. P2PMeth1]|uniref:UDP-4-amino-4, 6-dideoxy-N-acetyl-beta-L-altrosamine N-acetyltransferase n=1 Tax=Stappia sp. P2PMeth1 TaxID=2003586 RepID=UPI001AD91CF7|nr:UDP-4-amino-4,6-dideoxy-N-acetyl-beta-L-altrosamine N-acetyltransferase [Stappia sp. P2PMeth1]